MSTSQMIGSVEISADANPVLRDTSDREGLVASREVSAFEEILKSVVGDVLENERDVDRQEREHAERPLKDLLGDLSTEGLVARVEELAKAQAGAREAVPVVGEYSRRIEKARGEIERRLVYYSRLATVGTIAQMLVHEIRNQTTTIGGLVDAVAKMGVESHLPEAIRQLQKRAVCDSVEHTPVTDPELEQTRKGTCQRLWMDLVVMPGEPLDLIGDAPGDWAIKLGKVLKRLRGKSDVTGQARFSLFFTSSNGIRSEEARDD